MTRSTTDPTPAALAALEQLALTVKEEDPCYNEDDWLPADQTGIAFQRACTPSVILALLAAARRGAGDTEALSQDYGKLLAESNQYERERDAYRAELQRVATECGHHELWESAAEAVRGKLMHYDELEAEHRNTETTNG